MTIIEASSGTYRSRVDGTIVLSVEISPIHRADALALFGMPGTPLALAALKVGHAAKSDEPAVEEKPKGGKLAMDAAIIGDSPAFQAFAQWKGYRPDSDSAAQLIRNSCGVDSRAELDHSTKAAHSFGRLMGEFRWWQQGERAGMPVPPLAAADRQP